MIDKVFWLRIAKEWKKQDDGIQIPEVKTGNASGIVPTAGSMEDIMDDEINDILADLGLDEIEIEI